MLSLKSMKYQVLRLDRSPYLDGDFTIKEKKALESSDIEYVSNVYELNSEKNYFLITNTHTDFDRIPEIVLDRTELIIHPNSGYDNISANFLAKSNVPIILGSPIRAGAVTEYILSSVLKHYAPIDNHIYWKDIRTWDREILEDKSAYVIGAGNIGARVVKLLEILCQEVNYTDPYSEYLPPKPKIDMEQLAKADILIISAELTSKTKNLIDKKILEQLNKSVLIINTARGEIIDEEGLLEFLETHKTTAAYLDVFSEEPFSPGFGKTLTNLNKTSHIAGVYRNLPNRIINFEKEIIHFYVKQKSLNNLDSFWKKYSKLNYQDINAKRDL